MSWLDKAGKVDRGLSDSEICLPFVFLPSLIFGLLHIIYCIILALAIPTRKSAMFHL